MDKLKELLPNMDKLNGLLEDSDIVKLLPKLDTVWDTVTLLTRLFVMAGPLILLGLGIWYFFAPPREANHRAGFRTAWGMGSVDAWRFTQKTAGSLFSLSGLVLTVIMAVKCSGFPAMDPVDALQAAGKCIIGQLITVAAVCVLCHLIPPFLFDWKGVRRSGKPARRQKDN